MSLADIRASSGRIASLAVRGAHMESPSFLFIFGFFTILGLLLPFYGRSFSFFGIHVRIVSYLLLASACLITLPSFRFRDARNDLGLLLIVFLALTLIHAAPVQFKSLLTMQYKQPYYEGKLALIFQISLPYLIAGYIISPLRDKKPFIRGAWWGLIAAGILAFIILFFHRKYFLGGTYKLAAQFPSLNIFSTISMSIMLSLGTIALIGTNPKSNYQGIPAFICGSFFVLCIFLLYQRAHLIIIALIIVARFLKLRLKSIIIYSVAFAAVIGALFFFATEQVFNVHVVGYWHEALKGYMFKGRLEMWVPPLIEALKNPLGSGLGHYALVHEVDLYPHNVFIEAFYELGILGALSIGIICAWGFLHALNILPGRQQLPELKDKWFLSGIVFFCLVHDMKSGTLAYFYLMPFFMFIAPPCMPERLVSHIKGLFERNKAAVGETAPIEEGPALSAKTILNQAAALFRENRFFLIGFLAAAGVLLPYFGQSFNIAGVHVRIISYMVILSAIGLALPIFEFKAARNDLAFLTIILFGLAALYAAPVQLESLLSFKYRQPYYEGKLVLMLELSLPYIAAGYVISPFSSQINFRRGVWWGFLGLCILGLIAILFYLPLLFGPLASAHSFARVRDVMSNISISIVFCLGLIAVLDAGPKKLIHYILLIITGAALLICIVRMNQRAHLLVIVVLFSLRIFRARLKTAIIVSTVVLLIIGALLAFYPDVWLSLALKSHVNQLLSGERWAIRTDMWLPALIDSITHPLGHGLGSFALINEYLYPHNIFVEAFYELGLAGAACMALICILALSHLGILIKNDVHKGYNEYEWFLSASVVFILLHDFKAGTIAYIYPLLFLMFIAPERLSFTPILTRALPSGSSKNEKAG